MKDNRFITGIGQIILYRYRHSIGATRGDGWYDTTINKKGFIPDGAY